MKPTRFFAVLTLVGALLMAVSSASITHLSAGEPAPDSQVLTELLNEFLAGASRNEAAAHQRFWADQLIYTSSSGARFGKADILEGMEEEEPGPETIYSAEDIQIQQYGDTAVVAFRLLGQVQEGEGELLQFFNTGTFVKADGEWRAVAWQATRTPE